MKVTLIELFVYFFFDVFLNEIQDKDAIYLTNHENCQFGPASNFSKKIPSPYPIYPRSMKLLSMYLISPTF